MAAAQAQRQGGRMPGILAVPEGSTVVEDKSQLQHRVQPRSNQLVSPSVGLKVRQPVVEPASCCVCRQFHCPPAHQIRTKHPFTISDTLAHSFSHCMTRLFQSSDPQGSAGDKLTDGVSSAGKNQS